jgi:hypothetical protein
MKTPRAARRSSQTEDTVVDLSTMVPAVAEAIAELDGCSPEAKEAAAEIVEAWMHEFAAKDRTEVTVGVELNFSIRLDEQTWVVGVVDRLSQQGERYIINEWKTTAGPSHDGKRWNAQVWLHELLHSIQLPTYVLALREGQFQKKDANQTDQTIYLEKDMKPLVRVRAATKTSPVQFWPTQDNLFDFSAAEVQACRNAYLNAAAQVRLLRATDRQRVIPWQYPGSQCFRQFGRDCEFLERCSSHDHPPHSQVSQESMQRYLQTFGVEPQAAQDPDTVVFSTSSYQLLTLCLEKYRLLKVAQAGLVEDTTPALQIGTAVHAGLAKFYELLK